MGFLDRIGFGKQEAPKQNPGSMTYHSFNSENKELAYTSKYNLSQPFINQYTGLPYVPFGEDNLYPYKLLEMYHGSPFHAAILDFKMKTIMGDGLEFTGPGKSLEDKITIGKLEKKLNRKFFKRFVQEYLIHERIYIQVHRDGGNFNDFEMVPSEMVRISSDMKNDSGYYTNPDWRRKRGVNEFIPAYDKYNKSDKIQMMQFQEESPGIYGYSIPVYATAANWILLDANIAFFQKQNMEYSINPSAIISFPQDIANKEEKRQFVDDLQTSFAGAKNAGKIMVFFSNGKENIPDVKITEANKLDKSFAGAQENIIRNVSYAHLVNPELMGVTTPGKLGMSNEMNEGYALYQTVFLENTQETIEEYLQEIVDCMGHKDIKVKIKRKEQYLPTVENKTEAND
jgi:hypothetical protein